MGDLILITGSREATRAMVTKCHEVIEWAQRRDHSIIVGDASGVDAAVRKACCELNVLCFVYGGYRKIRGPTYPGEQPTTVTGGYLARDRVMAQQCIRGLAIMLAPKTTGTWYTGTYVESLSKRMRWAVWEARRGTWSYYDRGQDIAVSGTVHRAHDSAGVVEGGSW